jgi:hypothetical protein
MLRQQIVSFGAPGLTVFVQQAGVFLIYFFSDLQELFCSCEHAAWSVVWLDGLAQQFVCHCENSNWRA